MIYLMMVHLSFQWIFSGPKDPMYRHLRIYWINCVTGHTVYAYSYDSDDVGLSDDEIKDFLDETGIDLGSNTFNFEVINDQADYEVPIRKF